VTFKVKDAVVHPNYGTGIITEIKERHIFGQGKRYYSIDLLGEPGTTVMVPVGKEDNFGLRPPVPKDMLSRLWRILRAKPGDLPSDHKKRYAVIEEKLQDGDFFQIAEAVRDLAWRREEKRRLTTVGKRLYETGLGFLASELAAVQGSDVDAAEAEIAEKLEASVANAAA
jgi:RNA polymerase-interacting CarD/CdnL/TRCF family regulator